ncbi:MAG: 30S ribosomal protein S8 [Gammaproteobacteria bacterium]|nr:30S ribosomal protein S8 [Gammaproteobacteria bacterium]
MAMTDPIADMLTRIRNAAKASHASVSMPDSRIKREIADVLQQEGYIRGFSSSSDSGKPILSIDLKYYQGRPVIDSLERVSKPGRRVYRGIDNMPLVNAGLGVTIVSTSKGIMTAKTAKHMNVGGEVICTVS